jgi:hypothetical protein
MRHPRIIYGVLFLGVPIVMGGAYGLFLLGRDPWIRARKAVGRCGFAIWEWLCARGRTPIDLEFLAGRPASDGKPAEAGWREALYVIGAVCFLRSVALFSTRLAWGVAGVGLMAVAWLLSYGSLTRR